MVPAARKSPAPKTSPIDISKALSAWYAKVPAATRAQVEQGIDRVLGEGKTPDQRAADIGGLIGRLGGEDWIPVILVKLEPLNEEKAAALLKAIQQKERAISIDAETFRRPGSLRSLDAITVPIVARFLSDPRRETRLDALQVLESIAARGSIFITGDPSVRKVDPPTAAALEGAFHRAGRDADERVRKLGADLARLVKRPVPASEQVGPTLESRKRRTLRQQLDALDPRRASLESDIRGAYGDLGRKPHRITNDVYDRLRGKPFAEVLPVLLSMLDGAPANVLPALLGVIRLLMAAPRSEMPETLQDIRGATVDALVDRVSHPNAEVRRAVAAILADVAQPLINVQTGEAIATLDALARARLRAALETASRDSDPEAREAAQKGLRSTR